MPLGNRRATLTVASKEISTAVESCNKCHYVYLGYVQINGNRPKLGMRHVEDGGSALVEFGGNSIGQTIDSVRAYEPRGWCVLHGREGTTDVDNPSCVSMTIRNNQIGPSGNSPSFSTEPRGLGLTKDYTSGQWADGISLACTQSHVYGNNITDATDGGIVLFGAPGSHIYNNRIVAQSRVLMGGINMVDFDPYKGNFTGVVVENNTLHTDGSMIKVGIAMGTMVWWSKNSTSRRPYNGVVQDNYFTSSNDGYFGYGIAVAGYNSTVIQRNTFSPEVKFDGVITPKCIPRHTPPNPRNLTYDPTTTHDVTIQATSSTDSLCHVICIGPLGSEGGTRFEIFISYPSGANLFLRFRVDPKTSESFICQETLVYT
ncbi:uncharacterized protein MELLADRAFT_102180 [Melampsora larici-populina 98AG31]|uniref:Right handed beta helix domain-containing protein n=1 Tax=Melampsora larici-populina (strain 98AG31 / pathotype 3-4-7) TaxID=747676 RepID=F4R7G1_MELLP|nr:uncharacterized protein MELLADRAFT_102180 [Melampsora larici-populina 98AG31]EGG11310.1 hypothetical protein MELLADRAFT_102180 [Melampsora larici-populina 98AG31]